MRPTRQERAMVESVAATRRPRARRGRDGHCTRDAPTHPRDEPGLHDSSARPLVLALLVGLVGLVGLSIAIVDRALDARLPPALPGITGATVGYAVVTLLGL